MNIKKIVKDVRGAALVYVIVAAAIIVLLGAATTATAYVNLRATQIQEKSDNNFYSADSIMNAIVSGLEADISKAYELAYTNIITNINTYTDMDKAEEEFNTQFLNELDTLLNDSPENGGSSFSFMYSPSHIQGYVQELLPTDVAYTITALNGDNFLDITDTGAVLRNLHVTYEDDTGYYDEITTDIRIDVPEFDPSFIEKSSVQINGIVIDDGLEIGYEDEYIDRGIKINSNVYINERESDHSAILMRDKMYLEIIAPDEVIVGGQIETQEQASLTIKGSSDALTQIKFWTENFDFGRYTTAELIGLIFVDDDLEINGSHSNITLSGEYYGYGKDYENVDSSSAININGAKSQLDIRKLDMLVLGGSSYIATADVAGLNNKDNTDNIQTGESISVKSNQIAYLVDDKEFTSADVANFVSNPMSYTQYSTMVSSNGGESKMFSRLLSKELSYKKADGTKWTYAAFGAEIVPIYSNVGEDGEVYLYLNFDDPDDAANYFVTAYKGNSLLSQRLRTYAAQYITSLQLNPESSFLVNENYINTSIALYSSDNIPGFADGLGYEQNKPDSTTMEERLTVLENEYWGNHQEDGDGEKFKVMYSKLINENQVKRFITEATALSAYTDYNTNNKIIVIDNGVILKGTSNAKAIVVDNAGKEAYELEDGQGILIATGDVEIKGDWLGTIIVGGRAYCTGGSSQTPIDLTFDQTTVDSVLPLYFTTTSGGVETSMSVLNLFIDYENMSVNNATNNEGFNADMISQCLSFSNWNRD